MVPAPDIDRATAVRQLLIDLDEHVGGIAAMEAASGEDLGRREALAYLSGVLTALSRVGDLSRDELRARQRQILEAYGYDVEAIPLNGVFEVRSRPE